MNPLPLSVGGAHLVIGPASVRITAGLVEVIGARFGPGQALEVPAGRRVPLITVEAGAAEIAAKDGNLQTLEVTPIPPEWDQLAERVAREHQRGTLTRVVVCGEVDTGKTFLATWLANRLLPRIGRTALLDCDPGQSYIGPPGTFGMLVLERPEAFPGEVPATHLYMLGAHAPGLHLLPTVVGLHKLCQKARETCELLIIDTTGWVQGDGGRAVKRAKLDLLEPQHVVLLQRASELEHLVRHLPAERVTRLAVSRKAAPIDLLERRALRERLSMRYLANARVIELPFRQVVTDRAFLLSGNPITLDGALWAERLSGWEGTLVVTAGNRLPDRSTWPGDLGMIRHVVAGNEVGVMVALLDARGDALAIGRLDRVDYARQRFLVRTPLSGGPEQVKGLQFGSLRLGEKGEDAGFIEPGYL